MELIRKVYQRVGEAREMNQITVQQLIESQGKFYAVSDDAKQVGLESGTAKISTSTYLPFGYCFDVSQAQKMIDVSDTLGCSIDYLFGRTDCPDLSVEKVPEPGTGWKTGNPEEAGTYVLILARNKYVGPKAEIWNWNGEEWTDCGVLYDKDLDGKIFGWCPMLDMTEAQYD